MSENLHNGTAMPTNTAIVVGAGLAGLTCAFELIKRGCRVTVLESRQVLGGRTSSWVEDGMPVESGLHKFLGVYRALPALLEEAGAKIADVITWVDELEIHHPGGPNGRFTTAPYRHPLGTAASLFGNNALIPLKEKAKLAAMGTAGMARCIKDPLDFDRISVAQYAAEFGVSPEVTQRVLTTSTQAILFLPADRFSAYAAFAPIVESVKHGLTARLGAFKGGMTSVMIHPIAKAIVDRGGIIRTGSPVQSLLVENGRVTGVRLDDAEMRADAVVLAVPLHAAQDVLRAPFGNHESFQPMLRLPSLSAATIQFELNGPLLSSDRTNFSSTSICCFAEQSRTTFTQVPGRFSAILYPPEDFIHLPPDDVVNRVYEEADKLALPLRKHAKRYRIVNHLHDFYAMQPGTESLRPEQRTPILGLALAGDYTKQPFSASMEGAVLSGQRAAEALTDRV
jgi:15-cis-phytoene desaturase